jgi:hypothetical protein
VRTWSIGIGELGDLLWSPERYRAVFHGFDSPWLLASIKHGPSDFFRLLPHNPTLGLPGPRQIVELQNRREYELFGMVPNSIARLHQDVLHHAAANPCFAGVWAWNSTGGWGGGRAAIDAQGWSVWTELSSALTAALVRDPGLDTCEFTERWCAERFGGEFGAALAHVYLESEELIERGWYNGRLPAGRRTLGAIYLPSLLWIWWMRPTASLLIWAYLASASGDSQALRSARVAAAERLDWHADRLAALAPPDAAGLAESVRYLADAIAVAHTIRSFMDPAFDAAWYGRRERWDELVNDVREVRAALKRHRSCWAGNADLPALELDEIEAFLSAIERAPPLIWLQARGACLLIGQLRRERRAGCASYAAGLAVAGALAVVLSGRNRQIAGIVGVLASLALASPLRQRAIGLALPWLSRRFHLLPSIFFETGPAFTEWTA